METSCQTQGINLSFVKHLFIFFSSFFFFQLSTAQENYRAVHWGLKEGLSHPCVYHMLKDANGFLWTGTQGALCRFDGSEFKKYYYDPLKSGTFNAKTSFGGLVEDSLHHIWIGTERDLYRYDILADTFTRFQQGNPLLATRDELIGIEPGGIVFAYNIHSLTKRNLITLAPTDSIWPGLNLFYSFFDERSNSLWMLRGDHTNNRWSGGGLLQIKLTSGEKKYFNWPCYRNIPGHDHSAEAMCYDRQRNCLWINSSEGLMQFTLEDRQFHFAGEKNSFFNSPDYHRYVGIDLDLQGRVWLATNPKGIVIYDPADYSVTFPFGQDSTLQKEISDANACIYSDRDGIVWSGFWLGKGIYQIVPFSPSVVHYKKEASISNSFIGTITNFQNAGQSKIWIGSQDALHRIYDAHTGAIELLPDNDLPPELKQTAILPIWIDTLADRAFLYCFSKGTWMYDLNTKNGQRLIFKDSANQEINVSERGGFKPFKDGFLISAVQDKRQIIFLVNQDSIVAREVVSFPFTPGKLFELKMVDDQKMFLRGSHETGNLTYTYTNNKWIQRPNPLDSVPWNHIIYNNIDQAYWIVSEKQLIKYGSDFRVMHIYTPAEGLPDIDIFSLLPDTKGNIWFNTDRSIHQLNIETGVISTLSEKDGFLPQNFSGGPILHRGPDGDLYLGAGIDGEGFIRISPDKYSHTSSSIYLKSLNINQKPFPLTTGINHLSELSLSYFQNQITLETGVIDYYSKGNSHIRYKLNGLNDDWQYGPANYTIRYDGLSPGSYTLFVQSSNAANEFIGPIKSLVIHISPPWWKTWWAYLSYALIFLGVLWAFSTWRERSLRTENERLETKVDERTNELKTTLDNLKSTQAQLIQSEKMASLGELTAGIAHEIQNPLNFVNNFSEVNKDLLSEMKEEIDKGNLGEVKLLANDVIENEEKIHHHGKRADAIVKSMLQHSRLGAAETNQKESTDLNALADEYLRMAYHAFQAGMMAKEKDFNCELQIELDPTLPLIKVIPQDIARVLLNLYNNAFWAMGEKVKSQRVTSSGQNLAGLDNENPSRNLPGLPEGYIPTLTLTTRNLGTKIEIHIRDNGPGIPQNVIDKIFQPFFTTKPTGQGTGLGLSLSYDIIKAHRGNILVSSFNEPSDGTVSGNNVYGPQEGELKSGEATGATASPGEISRPIGGTDFTIILPIN